jgi:hypothetical protein
MPSKLPGLGSRCCLQIPDGVDANLVVDALRSVAVNIIVRLSTDEQDAKGVTNMLVEAIRADLREYYQERR